MRCHYCGQCPADCDCAGEHTLTVQSTALALEELLDRQLALHAELARHKYDQAMVERALREAGYTYPSVA